jgi:glycosyltransferase involved in cell wall biosynthesis
VLAQSYPSVRVIVVDDGSTDDTAVVVRGYDPARVEYIRQDNSGVAVARNRGIEESRSRWIGFLDADDTWYPHKLERQMQLLQSDATARFCYSAFTVVDNDLQPLGVGRSFRYGSALEDLLTRGNVVGSICTVICDRELLRAAGGFDSRLSQCADWNMWVKVAQFTEFLYLDEPLVTYRQHETNMSRNAALLENDSLLVLEHGFALEKLPESLRMRRGQAFARNYTVLAGTYFRARQYGAFMRCGVRAVTMQRSQLKYFLAYPLRAIRRLLAAA